MPTDEERRKVAARLQRIIGKCKYYYPLCLLYNEIIGGNCEAVGRNVEECDNECFDSLLARLAELIDPTEHERTIADNHALIDRNRKVAKRLRELAASYEIFPAWSAIDSYELPTPISDALRACGLGRAVHASEICARLADLIEPEERTCHIYDTDHGFEDSIRCDACQMTFRRPWQPFKFCPNCGAKVTGVEE